MNFLLSQELGNAIMAYLVKQPYEEVSGLIEGLKSLPTVNVTQPVTSTESTIDPVATTTETPETSAVDTEATETK